MTSSSEIFLGIDIGGTNVKLGLVTGQGELLSKVKFPTKDLAQNNDFVSEFIIVLRSFFKENTGISKIGIGVPGTISKDRLSTIDLPNIPSLSNQPFIPILSKEFPDKAFFLENDANAAALGEFVFAKEKLPDNLLFLTLGTGVGGAAILDGKIFKGGMGNGMEVGHIFASSKQSVEDLIGKKGIVAAIKKLLKAHPETKSKLHKLGSKLTAKDVVSAAKKGDRLALTVFEKFGKVLGRCIVSSIRVLDVHTVIIGGGVSDTFDFIETSMMDVIHLHLPTYYTVGLEIKIASLGNNAGILGAASLCMQDS